MINEKIDHHFNELSPVDFNIFGDASLYNKMVKENVQKQFSKCGSLRKETDCIVFLDEGNDFEKQLIDDGFGDEIKMVIANFEEYHNAQHRAAKEKEIQAYTDEELYKIISNAKTQYGPAIAEHIILNKKSLPPKIIELFKKITAILKMEGQRHES